MDCQQCENLMTDYLEETLSLPVRRQFAEHLMACLACRHLCDDVRAALRLCHATEPVEPIVDLSGRILQVTSDGPMVSCTVFDELISDYLDGFIAAADFHVFEAHFATCQRCGRLMSSVRAAHDLFKEIEAVQMPEGLPERILQATSGVERETNPSRPGLFRRWALAFSFKLETLKAPRLKTEYVSAVLLTLATIGLLLVDFSDDMTIPGIYRHARVQVEEQIVRLGQFGVFSR